MRDCLISGFQRGASRKRPKDEKQMIQPERDDVAKARNNPALRLASFRGYSDFCSRFAGCGGSYLQNDIRHIPSRYSSFRGFRPSSMMTISSDSRSSFQENLQFPRAWAGHLYRSCAFISAQFPVSGRQHQRLRLEFGETDSPIQLLSHCISWKAASAW